MFQRRGFAAVSAEEIVAAAGVTRGALYHHFDGKKGLFEAVVVAAMAKLHADLAASAGDVAASPMAALRAIADAFLDRLVDARLRRLLFVDAPSVLGWTRWRALDAEYGLGGLERVIAAAVAAGEARPQSVTVAAHLLLAAMIEAAMLIAADDGAASRADVRAGLHGLIDALA